MDPANPAVPAVHSGTHYSEVLAAISARLRPDRYLEIGVNAGEVFRKVHCRHGIGVDPAFVLTQNVCQNKERVSLFQVTSDEFFRRRKRLAWFGWRFDMAFVDGMHLFEFALRDFINAEAMSTRRGVIAIHDCLPLNAGMAEREPVRSLDRTLGTPFHGWWTGDVWKIIPVLARYRPDLKVELLDAPPTGLAVVTDLNPSSRVLARSYDRIVAEFASRPTEDADVARLYSEHAIGAATALLGPA